MGKLPWYVILVTLLNDSCSESSVWHGECTWIFWQLGQCWRAVLNYVLVDILVVEFVLLALQFLTCCNSFSGIGSHWLGMHWVHIMNLTFALQCTCNVKHPCFLWGSWSKWPGAAHRLHKLLWEAVLLQVVSSWCKALRLNRLLALAELENNYHMTHPGPYSTNIQTWNGLHTKPIVN